MLFFSYIDFLSHTNLIIVTYSRKVVNKKLTEEKRKIRFVKHRLN